jgi:glycosyltransferase involved in cell wall biosynthesis
LFDFIKYIQPLWYYRLVSRIEHAVLLDKEELDKLVEAGRIFRGNYGNGESVYLDLAYQALQMGCLLYQSEMPKFQNSVICDVADNYRFVYRHFGSAKALYVLVWRIISFNNLFREIYSFLKNRESKVLLTYIEPAQNRFLHEIFKEPRVSIIIPTLNRYEYLKDVLSDLEKQTYKNFDVWICDQSDDYKEDFYKSWNLDLHVFKQAEKALWRARNRCVEDSDGEYLLFFDDDSRVESNWIQKHLEVSLEGYVSAGITDTLTGGGRGQKSDYYHMSEMLDTGNVMIKRSVFETAGVFDEKFERMRMGDGEYGLRCLLHGFPIVSNPHAGRVHLKGESGGLRQMGAWDAIHSIGLFKPRPIPSSLYLARKHFDNETALIYGLSQLPKSMIPYRFKGSGMLKKVPYLFGGFLLSPILLFTFWMSWRKSSEMLGK